MLWIRSGDQGMFDRVANLADLLRTEFRQAGMGPAPQPPERLKAAAVPATAGMDQAMTNAVEALRRDSLPADPTRLPRQLR